VVLVFCWKNNTATLQSSDSPATGGQTNSQAELAIDVQFNFELQLLWKYPSGIYYPLAYVKWQPNFYGTATGNNLNKGPVNTIQVLHGVTADIKPTPNNDTPGSENTNQIANNVLAWR